MIDGAQREIAFEGAEGFFHMDQLHVVEPEGVGGFVGEIRAQEITAFAAAEVQAVGFGGGDFTLGGEELELARAVLRFVEDLDGADCSEGKCAWIGGGSGLHAVLKMRLLGGKGLRQQPARKKFISPASWRSRGNRAPRPAPPMLSLFPAENIRRNL